MLKGTGMTAMLIFPSDLEENNGTMIRNSVFLPIPLCRFCQTRPKFARNRTTLELRRFGLSLALGRDARVCVVRHHEARGEAMHTRDASTPQYEDWGAVMEALLQGTSEAPLAFAKLN